MRPIKRAKRNRDIGEQSVEHASECVEEEATKNINAIYTQIQ